MWRHDTSHNSPHITIHFCSNSHTDICSDGFKVHVNVTNPEENYFTASQSRHATVHKDFYTEASISLKMIIMLTCSLENMSIRLVAFCLHVNKGRKQNFQKTQRKNHLTSKKQKD